MEVGLKEGSVKTNLIDVRKIPVQDLWFEIVWKEFIEDNHFGC